MEHKTIALGCIKLVVYAILAIVILYFVKEIGFNIGMRL